MTDLINIRVGDGTGLASAVLEESRTNRDLAVGAAADVALALGSYKATSGPDICCSGDSMTASAGGNGTTYPGVLATLTGRTVHQMGVGGETSKAISARLGSRPLLASVIGGSIPASGYAVVLLATDDGSALGQGLMVQGNRGINPCSIAGVVGTLSLVSGEYRFTRTTNGSVVPVSFPQPLITDASVSRRGDIQVMWWGQNDGGDGTSFMYRERCTIEWMPGIDKRWLVLGLTTGTAASRATMEAMLTNEFGRRFVNLRAYLSSAAIYDAGITPTSDDLAQIATGSTPVSLRADATHLNAAGYTRVAHLVYWRMLEMGWL